jgi:muramoyltetrapeptide carboxypeptidase
MKVSAVIKPPRLNAGDLIGVVSPAGPVHPSDLQKGVDLLESSGFRVRVAPHAYDQRDYLAGEDRERLEDLHAMFLDPEVHGVFCTRGGYGSLRLLNQIRFSVMRDHPKVFVGYSDISALLLAVHAKTGLVTFHGPMVRGLEKDGGKNWDSLKQLISSPAPFRFSLTGGSVLSPGRAEGPLLGGNLATICHLIETSFLPSLKGSILLLEEVGEPLYRVDRMLTHLMLSGHLSGLSGLIMGGFEGCGDEGPLRRLFMDRLGGLSIPLLMGAPVGHGEKNRAFPLGLRAEMDTERLVLSIPGSTVLP